MMMAQSMACCTARCVSPHLALKPSLPQTGAHAALQQLHGAQHAAGRLAAAGVRARAASSSAAADAGSGTATGPSICIVGAGVIGMTSALRIKQVGGWRH